LYNAVLAGKDVVVLNLENELVGSLQWQQWQQQLATTQEDPEDPWSLYKVWKCSRSLPQRNLPKGYRLEMPGSFCQSNRVWISWSCNNSSLKSALACKSIRALTQKLWLRNFTSYSIYTFYSYHKVRFPPLYPPLPLNLVARKL
jgi:hypothetical protein